MDLADDLRPAMNRVVRILPRMQWKLGPTIDAFEFECHTSTNCTLRSLTRETCAQLGDLLVRGDVTVEIDTLPGHVRDRLWIHLGEA